MSLTFSNEISFVATDTPRVFRKEVINVGSFIKGEMKFDIDEKLLSHWASTFQKMAENNVDVPVPLGHTTNPEKNRGFVKAISLDKNKSGKLALFADIEFVDDEAAKLAKRSQTSIHVPVSYTDGQGNVYHWPITHIALTNYPVVSGLGKFELLAAAFENGENPMEFLKLLAELMGIDITDDMSEEALMTKLREAFSTLRENGDSGDDDGGDGDDDDGGMEMSLPPKVLAKFKETRETELGSLLEAGKITPAVYKQLRKEYCNDAAISLSFNNESNEYDRIVNILKGNAPVLSFSSRSGAQVLPSSTESPLIKDAERRANEMK